MNREQFNEEIYNIVKKSNISEDFIKDNIDKNSKVFLYGAGHALEYYIRYITKRKIKIEAIIDSNKKGEVLGYPIFTIDEVAEKYDMNQVEVVVSAPSKNREIRKILEDYLDSNQIHAFEVELYEYYGTNLNEYKKYIYENIDDLYEVYNMLEDDRSRKILLKVIEGRITGDLDTVSDIWETNQYWPGDIINFNKNEVIVECGSFDGKTLVEMYKKLEGEFKHIYCFEPDKICKDILKKVIQEIDQSGKITFIEKGTYRESTILFFNSDTVESGLSKVDENGTDSIQVVAIDEVVTEPITYVKMDIEGAELDTLIGAEEQIRMYHPKLAVCIYHKDEDIIEIIKYLKKLNKDYKFYIRHHNCNLTETVLYAI